MYHLRPYNSTGTSSYLYYKWGKTPPSICEQSRIYISCVGSFIFYLLFKTFKLFGLPIFRQWAYQVIAIPERQHARQVMYRIVLQMFRYSSLSSYSRSVVYINFQILVFESIFSSIILQTRKFDAWKTVTGLHFDCVLYFVVNKQENKWTTKLWFW